MLYVIIAEDAPNSLDKRVAVRPRHFPRVQALLNEGKLLAGGGFPAIDSATPGPAGFSGSLIVAEFASLEEAEAWARADPYATEGVWRDITVKPFRKALP
jgi:uncharacterized protein